MALARIGERSLVVGVFFVTQMVDGLKVTLRRLVRVMPYMLRCGVVFGIGHDLERAFFSSNSGEQHKDFDRHDF